MNDVALYKAAQRASLKEGGGMKEKRGIIEEEGWKDGKRRSYRSL